MSDFRAKIVAELDTSKIPSSIKKIENQKIKLNNFTLNTQGLGTKIQQALNGYKFTLNLTNVKVNNLSKTIEGNMRSAGTRAGQQFSQSLVTRINTQLSNGGFDAAIARLNAQYNKLSVNGLNNTQMNGQLLKAKADLQELQRLQSAMATSGSSKELVSNYREFVSVLDRARNGLSIISSESRTFVNELQIANLDNSISQWMEKNSRATKDFGGRLEELKSKLAQLSAAGGTTGEVFNPIKREFEEIKAAAIATGKVGQSFGDVFKKGFSRLTTYVSASTVIYQSINALRQMYQNVYNIDKEMTELKKVTDETASSYDKFLKNSATVSKQIGTTISDLVSSTADFARLGYSFEDSQELAKVANIYSVVGDEIDSIDTATKSLISTMTAFNSQRDSSMEQGEFALSIIDKFNEVGKRHAQ